MYIFFKIDNENEDAIIIKKNKKKVNNMVCPVCGKELTLIEENRYECDFCEASFIEDEDGCLWQELPVR